MKNLRFGILSTSSIAPRFIAGVRAAGAGEILALSSRTLEKAEEKAKLWGIPRAYGSHRELLEDKAVDVVYISTVNALHYTWAKAALEAGKHVICEKPCTTTEAQTRELFALAKENPHATDDEIDAFLAGNLCRCSGYVSQRRAVKKYLAMVAEEVRA